MSDLTFIKDNKAYTCKERIYKIDENLKPGREIIYLDKDKFFFADIEIHGEDGQPVHDVLEYAQKLDSEDAPFKIFGSVTISNSSSEKIASFKICNCLVVGKDLVVMTPDDENADYLIFSENCSLPPANVYNYISFDGKLHKRVVTNLSSSYTNDQADAKARKADPYEKE